MVFRVPAWSSWTSQREADRAEEKLAKFALVSLSRWVYDRKEGFALVT